MPSKEEIFQDASLKAYAAHKAKEALMKQDDPDLGECMQAIEDYFRTHDVMWTLAEMLYQPDGEVIQ